ncbi:vesicle transport protein SEC20-like isoform X2 [Dysidea avara]|uniref:vesicle transport protein SEC20-like isoform X2 n=1 Tax=Dysidea avara TaxID=196820 RepID=UPI00332A3E94
MYHHSCTANKCRYAQSVFTQQKQSYSSLMISGYPPAHLLYIVTLIPPNRLQNAVRQANLECKKAMDKQQRQDLFSTKDGIRNRKDNRDSLLQTASTITEGLIEARQTLAAQVKRNEEAMHALVSSSNKIKGTDIEMKNVSAAVNTSHKLITKYGRRDITDKVLMSLGLLLFFGTVFYILQKRLLPNFLRWT